MNDTLSRAFYYDYADAIMPIIHPYLRTGAANVCSTCGHSLTDNAHGFDQNDGYITEDGKLILHGTCTYCKVCRGATEGGK